MLKKLERWEALMLIKLRAYQVMTVQASGNLTNDARQIQPPAQALLNAKACCQVPRGWQTCWQKYWKTSAFFYQNTTPGTPMGTRGSLW